MTLPTQREGEAMPGPWVQHPRFREYIVPLAHANRAIGGAADDERDRTEYAQHIARIPDEHRHRSVEEQRAIRRLVIAAPDLLAALESIANGTVMIAGGPFSHAETALAYQEIARAALAKARP